MLVNILLTPPCQPSSRFTVPFSIVFICFRWVFDFSGVQNAPKTLDFIVFSTKISKKKMTFFFMISWFFWCPKIEKYKKVWFYFFFEIFIFTVFWSFSRQNNLIYENQTVIQKSLKNDHFEKTDFFFKKLNFLLKPRTKNQKAKRMWYRQRKWNLYIFFYNLEKIS